MEHDDRIAASVREAVRSLEDVVANRPTPPPGAGRNPRPSWRVMAGIVVAVGLAAGAVSAWLVERSDDEPTRSEVRVGGPAGGAEPEPSWEQVPLGGIAAREGASLVLLDRRTVAIVGGRVPDDAGRLLVDIIDVTTGEVTSLAPLAVGNPIVAGSIVEGDQVTLLLESREVVTFPKDGDGAASMAASPSGAGPPLTSEAQASSGGALVDLSVPARWDAAAGSWQPLPSLPTDDSGYERRPAVAPDGTIVVAGFQAPTLVYAQGTNAWRELPPPPLPADAEFIGQPVLAAGGGRIALVDEQGNAAVLALADGGWAPLEVPDDPGFVEGCELHGVSTATAAVIDRCGDVLIVDRRGRVAHVDKPVTPAQHDLVSDGRHAVLLAWDVGALSLWRRAV
jgi:hypothetical protein